MSEIQKPQKFTIVAATYNVDKYLDKFFKTIIAQSLVFEEYINIIIVDDGSTDNSKKIIEKWVKKYPDNIQYIQKENGGQSSARNFGLEYVKTKWVTFIDPDDFIHKNYFENIDTFLSKEKKISIIATNLIYYFEKFNLYLDKHPLKYRFKEKVSILPANALKQYMHFSSSSALFQTKLIQNISLKFDEKIKPNFEDGHFIGVYLLNYPDSSIAFLSNAKYYYRKRKNTTSTIDSSWSKCSKYYAVLKFGYLDLFKKYNENMGKVPIYIQRMILYDLMWYYKKHISSPEIADFLSLEQRQNYIKLLTQLFAYIDTDTILNFELSGCELYHKRALLNLYKKSDISYQIMYIDYFSNNHTKIHCHYYSTKENACVVLIDGFLTPLNIIENKEFKFMDKIFITKYSIEFTLNKNSKNIQFIIDSIPTYINAYIKNGKQTYGIKEIKIDRVKKIRCFVKNIARKVLLNG